MKLSTRARYALRMMMEIARNQENQSAISLNDVSQHTRISRRYLEQLAISLKNASLIQGITGKKGGYILTQAAESIRLDQIIEAVIGPINVVDCVLRPDICMDAGFCECRWVYQTINEGIQKVLNELYLDDLVAGKRPDIVNREGAELGTSCPTRRSPVVINNKESG
jgi:Rrf2 family protein